MTNTKAGSGRSALITGASGGIGLELSRLFAADGHDLLIVSRDAGKLDKLAKEFESDHGAQVRIYHPMRQRG